jgi:hypothetical protein
MIELQPGAAPVGKAPYKMSPVEMKKLKVQLQGLLGKGYIHPSTTSWGCSALFVEKKDKNCVYVWITSRSMQSPSRISIHFHALTSCLIN